MTDQRQQRLADLLNDAQGAQGALIELESRLPRENEDVAGARRSWEKATRAVSDALTLVGARGLAIGHKVANANYLPCITPGRSAAMRHLWACG
jgi:hypothetical protein